MRHLLTLGPLLLTVTCLAAEPGTNEAKQKQVQAVLDDWHKAAAAADEARYFSHFTADAVFLGTDATERWARDEFRKWARPHFDKGKAWTFKPMKRSIMFSKDGNTAWFDEALETMNLGPCRGTGVLVLEGNTWKIAQYHLCVPIPNDVFDKVKKVIEGK